MNELNKNMFSEYDFRPVFWHILINFQRGNNTFVLEYFKGVKQRYKTKYVNRLALCLTLAGCFSYFERNCTNVLSFVIDGKGSLQKKLLDFYLHMNKIFIFYNK